MQNDDDSLHQSLASERVPDLFEEPARPARSTREPPPAEIVHAKALCRRIKRLKTRPDKIQCAHLICLNLVALLNKSKKG